MAMTMMNLTREQFAALVRGLCSIYSERADTLGREQGYESPACCELLALDLFIAGSDSRPANTVRAYLAASCDVQFKGEP